jgi:ubiquinone/menaquinone biosynthesis C-methylase UbiE
MAAHTLIRIDSRTKKEMIADVFDRAALGYGELSYLPRFGRRLVEFARIQPGSRVLDVATGRGAILFPAAERVGPGGQVIGIDLSDEMVRQTSAEIARRGLKNVQVQVMDAEDLQFPASTFDVVLCGFGLFFFPHLQAALAEFRRMLKSDGCLAVSTWSDHDPRWNWHEDLLTKYQATVNLRTEMLDRPDSLRSALGEADFSGVQIATQEVDWVLPDADAWWTAQWSVSARAGLERLTPPALERLKTEVFEKIEMLQQPDGFHYRLQAHFARAIKPLIL